MSRHILFCNKSKSLDVNKANQIVQIKSKNGFHLFVERYFNFPEGFQGPKGQLKFYLC